MSVHDHHLVQIEGAGDVMPVQFLLTSRVVPNSQIPLFFLEEPSVRGPHGETLVTVEG